MEEKQLQRILEGALFASDDPLSVDQMIALFEESDAPEKKTIRDTLKSLMEQYETRESGIELKQLASGYQFQVKADLAQWIRRLWAEKPPRYSRALMETLALVAYRQPITRGEIEEVRGVAVSSEIMRKLMDHGWVRVVGHRDVPGKPGLYATTKQFLDNFGMKTLEELPSLAEIQDLDSIGQSLEKQLNMQGIEILPEEAIKQQPESVEHDVTVEEGVETPEVDAEDDTVEPLATEEFN